MTLPRVTLPTGVVEVGGESLPIRSLSRAEAAHLNTFRDGTVTGDVDAAEAYTIAVGTGVTEEEATEWRKATDSGTVQAVVEAILSLSGLVQEGEPDPKSPGSEPS